MGKSELQPFADYLERAITAADYPTPTHFARKAGIDPSVVLRWLDAATRPSIKLLERAAPHLRVDVSSLIALAYPSTAAGHHQPAPVLPATHPLVKELGQLLPADPQDSPLPEDERQALESLIGHVISPYRRHLRRRRAG